MKPTGAHPFLYRGYRMRAREQEKSPFFGDSVSFSRTLVLGSVEIVSAFAFRACLTAE